MKQSLGLITAMIVFALAPNLAGAHCQIPCGIYDDELRRLFVYRVPYQMKEARRRIIQAGLPPVLGDRLLFGA